MIHFQLDTKEAERVLKNLQRGLTDLTPALRDAKDFQMQEVESQFATEGVNILGSKWKALAQSTIKQRIRKGFGASPILTASGKMRGANRVKKLNKNSIQIENPTHYFKYQGVRQVYGHSQKMIKRVLDIISEYIIKIAK